MASQKGRITHFTEFAVHQEIKGPFSYENFILISILSIVKCQMFSMNVHQNDAYWPKCMPPNTK